MNKIKKKYLIAIVGIGYVGLSNSILLAQNHKVVAIELLKEKVDKIKNKVSPIKDEDITQYLKNKDLDLKVIADGKEVYKNADFIIISTPTNYDASKNYFDTSTVEDIIKEVLSVNKKSVIIIKSTVPVGFTKKMNTKYNTNNILFSPEFLREGKALFDNLHPSRIIVGADINNILAMQNARIFANLLFEGAIDTDIPILIMSSTEAEAAKLFSNSYLAMRVGFFNELDTYSELNNLNSVQIIEGVCLDPRIGVGYNNPSFGYGGYCLPKDTKQLLANFKGIPENIVSAIVKSNETRKEFVSSQIFKKFKNLNNPKKVGIYRIIMKANSDNFRDSSVFGIIKYLHSMNLEIIIYEPTIKDLNVINNCKIVNDLVEFKELSSIIIANRYSNDLDDVIDKVYTRDIYQEN